MVQSVLKYANCPVVRSPGIVYQPGIQEYDKYIVNGVEDYLVDSKRKSGVVGCWIAHIKALESICERKGITVIVEDDFRCNPEFFDVALQMINDFKEPFDVVVFDTWGDGPLEQHKVKERVYFPDNCSYPYYGGTHCLFINNAGATKIIKSAMGSPIKDYDGFLFRSEGFNTYIFYTALCGPRRLGSDINNEYGTNLYIEVLGFLRNMASTSWYKVRRLWGVK
jgi:GR25 family glycosyltransferase involved in LPS biosynthesis